MKKIFFIAIAFSFAQSVCAQTLAEWTKQKKTQKKYLLQQIAALQTYIGFVKKGYEIANKGLTTVRQIRNGEWNLHKDYFSALSAVNPAIKKYARVADIITLQVSIIKEFKALLSACRQSGGFVSGELTYIQSVCDNLLSQCLQLVDELVTVITSGNLQMSDAERLQRIDGIYETMQANHCFLQSFSNDVMSLSRNRIKEENTIKTLEKLQP